MSLAPAGAPISTLREGAAPTPGGRPESAPADEPRQHADTAIVCAACAHVVTAARHRCEMQGSHDHRFMNPGGFLYHIGCFREAVGCVVVGPDSLEYAWFAGFAWRCAHCGGCGAQLGWHFRTAERTAAFFGLVLDRLREVDAGPAT